MERPNNPSEFIGCVHEAVACKVGCNHANERVVRLDLTYTRSTHPVTSKVVLSELAAHNLCAELGEVTGLMGDGSEQSESGLRAANADDLKRFAVAYAGLGDAVGEQVWDLIDGNGDEVNPNAVRLIRERLYGLNAELDEALDEYDSTGLKD